MDIEADLQNQIEISRWIEEHLAVKYTYATENEEWAFFCFDIAIEHHAGIVALCKTSLYGPALALLRVQLEAIFRGLWLSYVATEKDIEKFKRDKVDPTFADLIKTIEAKLDIDSGLLSYIKDSQWSIYNSFTHTGIEALVRRIGATTTGYDNYRSEDVIKVLRQSGMFAVLTAVELASLTKSEEGLNKALGMAREYREK